MFICDCSFNEVEEERVGIEYRRRVFRVILRTDKPTVVGQLHDLDKAGGRVFAHTPHAGGLETLAVFIVEFKTMTMTLLHIGASVSLGGSRTGLQTTVVGSESHCATLVDNRLLILHEVDYIVGGGGIHLGRIGLTQSKHITGKLDDHALHAKADAECGNIVLATPLQGYKLALDASLAESRRNDYAVERRQQLIDIAGIELLGVDIHELELVVVIGSGLKVYVRSVSEAG